MADPTTLLGALPRFEVFQADKGKHPQIDPLACYTFLQLLKTADELLTLNEDILAAAGTRFGRFHLLMILLHCPEIHTPAHLADKTGVSRATITGLLDSLEKDRLVLRLPHPGDRRQTNIELTPAGNAFVDQVLPGYSRWFLSLIEPLTEDEQKLLVDLLQKIQVRLAELRNPNPHHEKET